MRRTLLLGGCIAVLFMGCASPEEDYCDGKCACEGCRAEEHAKCLNELDAERSAAEFRGCVPTYHDYIACRAATGTCVNGDWKTSCKPEKDRYKACVDDK